MTACPIALLLTLLPAACTQPAKPAETPAAAVVSRSITSVAFCQVQDIRVGVWSEPGLGKHAERLVAAIGEELEASGFVVIPPESSASPGHPAAGTRRDDADLRIELLDHPGEEDTWVLRLSVGHCETLPNPSRRSSDPIASIEVAPDTPAGGDTARGLVRALLGDPQGSAVHGLLLTTPHHPTAYAELAKHLADHPGVRAAQVLMVDPSKRSVKLMVLRDPAMGNDPKDLFYDWDGVAIWVDEDAHAVFPDINEILASQHVRHLLKRD